MSIEIKQKTVDLVFETKDGKPRGQKAKKGQKYSESTKALRLHFSLMGETSPELSPLSATFALDDKTKLYRYDWVVGATAYNKCYAWNWFDQIADERAMIIQMLIDLDKSGCGTSEANAFLMGLLPSKDTNSVFDPMLPKLADSVNNAANIVAPFHSTVAAFMKATAVVTSLVVSDKKGKKPYRNWFLYRFLDEKRKCCAVEWNVSRDVVHQYGSVLRGSILLAFHGTPTDPKRPLKLLLRPRLNFSNNNMDYDPPEEQLERKNPVELEIKPLSGQS